MEFSANNKIVRLCLQGMAVEAQNNSAESKKIFLQAWNEATHDLEKFLADHYLAQNQTTIIEKLKWLETALQAALNMSDANNLGILPALYQKIAGCYEDLGNFESAKQNDELAKASISKIIDNGPFYHGTKADLQIGDFLTSRGNSNYQPDLKMNHIYFTALTHGAGLAASLAKGDGRERVYIVEPIGEFESDPNVTDKKFPGNLTRSYRSSEPLKIVGELADWTKQKPNELKEWREKLANNKGEIIN